MTSNFQTNMWRPHQLVDCPSAPPPELPPLVLGFAPPVLRLLPPVLELLPLVFGVPSGPRVAPHPGFESQPPVPKPRFRVFGV